jgi:hypothetical protein
MASIYENAFITVAATRSSDSEGGCFSKLKGLDQWTRLESSGLYVRNDLPWDFPRSNARVHHGSWPLLRRAWVFQERHLSARIVHFTDYQVSWERRSMQEFETRDINNHWFKHKTESGIFLNEIAHYSHLKLTYASDRLPAIAAIVERTTRTRKDDVYIAGIWRNSFSQNCAWQCVDYEEGSKRTDDAVPTWSWASTPAAIAFYNADGL